MSFLCTAATLFLKLGIGIFRSQNSDFKFLKHKKHSLYEPLLPLNTMTPVATCSDRLCLEKPDVVDPESDSTTLGHNGALFTVDQLHTYSVQLPPLAGIYTGLTQITERPLSSLIVSL